MMLGSVIADYRWANRMGVREVAKNIGISAATLNRIENGETCDAVTLIKIHAWLHAPAQPGRRVSSQNHTEKSR